LPYDEKFIVALRKAAIVAVDKKRTSMYGVIHKGRPQGGERQGQDKCGQKRTRGRGSFSESGCPHLHM